VCSVVSSVVSSKENAEADLVLMSCSIAKKKSFPVRHGTSIIEAGHAISFP
jgi:hypothetical protein